jgi:DNA-binding transcriptional ArsR family regulator
MSIQVIELVYSRRIGGGGTRKAVAVKLADYARPDGTSIYPAVPTMARELELSDRTVQRELRALEEAQLLVPVRKGGRGQGSSTAYRLDLDRLAALPTVHPERSKGDTPPPLTETQGDVQSPSKDDCLSPLSALKGDNDDAKGDKDDTKGDSQSPNPSEILEDPDLSPPTPQARPRRARGARGRGNSNSGSEADQLLAPLKGKPEQASALLILIEPIVRQRKFLAPDPAYALGQLAEWCVGVPEAVLRAAVHTLLEGRHSTVQERDVVAAVREAQRAAGLAPKIDRPAAPAVAADGKLTITEREHPEPFKAWLVHHEALARARRPNQVTLAKDHRFMRVPTLYPPNCQCNG